MDMDMENNETFAPEYYEEDEMNRVEAHIEKYFGASDYVFHEIISPDIHVDIVMIPPREGRDYYTLVTMGMGAHVMGVPDEMRDDGQTRAELLINLPKDWKLGEGEDGWNVVGGDGENEADEMYYWPVRWLKILARMPGEYDTWLGWGHTVPTGDPLPGTDFSCMLLLNPGAFDGAAHECELPDGSKVLFYQVVPIYEDEMEYKLENGTDALLELLDGEGLEVVDESRPNVCEDADPLKGISFAQRIEHFRAWFEENERKLAKMASGKKGLLGGEYDREEIVEFVSEGTSLISKKIFFNIGGDHEFTFAVEGKPHLFFLYPRIASAMSGGSHKTLEKWTFNPWMQGSGGSAFGLDIYGVKVDTDGVLVGIEASDETEGGAEVMLRFYSKELATLEDDLCLNAFYILLDNALGEGLAHRCIDGAERVNEADDGMFPLTELASRLRDRLGDDDAAFDPSDRYFSYTREADEGGGLRGDVFMGTTQHMPLVNDYHGGSVETWRAFAAFGAKPVFLYYYPDPEMEGREQVDQRYDIQDAIEAEVLGARGSGTEIGILLGGAMGEERVYIDLLIYDDEAFMSRVGAVLERYDRAFFISDFRPGADAAPLFDATTQGLFEKLSNLHDAGEHVETAEAIAAIPEEERGYDIQSLFGRALNNIDRYEEALNILDTIKDRGESDPVWHWRVGYGLYFLDREREASVHFARAIDLGLDDENTREYLNNSLEYAEGREAFERRRANYVPRDPETEPFAGFDFTDFWDDGEYAMREYVGEPATDDMAFDAEIELGYTLPESYVWLMKRHNGGIPFKTSHPTAEPTSWAEDHVAITGIMGLDAEKRNSVMGEFGSRFMIKEWGYPTIGVAICDCPSAGHDMIFLDYRFCGPDGEPEVVHVDQEDDYKITFVADDFESFIRGLVKDEDFEE